MTTDSAQDRLQEIAPGLYQFDTHYVRPRHTACYVVVEQGRAAIVDCGVPANVPPLLAALEGIGVAREAVDWVIPTHAHLDHCGGAGQLMQELPAAKLATHPSAAPHLIDPEQLEAGVRALYGDDFFDREYAPIIPVEAARVLETEDDEEIELAGRVLRAIHTPGHAWHLESILDTATNTLISGDAFGNAYPELVGDDGPLVLPVVPPPQFKPEVYKASIDRIVALQPDRVALGHFGAIDDPERAGADLRRLVDDWVEKCWQVASADELLAAFLEAGDRELERRGRSEDQAAFREAYHMDLWLTAEGMWLWRRKEEKKRAEQAGGQGV